MKIIEVSHLTKEYKLGQLLSLKDLLLNTLRRARGLKAYQREAFKAIDDMSFTIEPGEVVGVIGANGAGKSTLLKHLAGISTATSGRVWVNGSVAPLIEVGAGLNPELTGRENIFLNAAILGIPKRVIRQILPQIVEFAELDRFIDTPVKRYSSGMTVRLGFSIATSIDADILIVDEVLAVGDLAFQRKCFDRMENLIKKQGRTVLIVSHNIRQIERMCTRVMLLDRGVIVRDGPTAEICNLFYERSDKKIREDAPQSISKAMETGEALLQDIHFENETGEPIETVEYGIDCFIYFRIKVMSPLDHPIFVIGVHTTDFVYLTTRQSPESLRQLKLTPGEYEFRCRIKNMPLLPGVYSLRFSIDVGEMITNIYYAENLLHFRVKSDSFQRTSPNGEGFFMLDTSWEHDGKVFQ